MNAIRTASDHTFPTREDERASDAPISDAATAATPWLGSRKALWAGRIMGGFVSLFLLFDAALKVLQVPVAVEGSAKLGYSPGVVLGLGVTQIICLILYLIPRTAVLGALLWTGYLGGAINTHLRIGSPLFSHLLFPIYVAVLLWGALWLRDARVRALLPVRAKS